MRRTFLEYQDMAETSAAKIKLAKNKKYMLVRYGRMNSLGFFEHHESKIDKTAKRVIVKTNKVGGESLQARLTPLQ